MAKSKAGRPTKFNAKLHIPLAEAYAQLGLTDTEISKKMNIAESTLNLWKLKHPIFSESINNGKSKIDDQVQNALLKRALGYEHPEEKIFCHQAQVVRANTTKKYPPDVLACSLWLRNRKPKEWSERYNIVVEDIEIGKPPSIEEAEFPEDES